MQKYGEGSIVEKQCPECHETFELRTAGTHIGDDNSIAVFCDDDPIVCLYIVIIQNKVQYSRQQH